MKKRPTSTRKSSRRPKKPARAKGAKSAAAAPRKSLAAARRKGKGAQPRKGPAAPTRRDRGTLDPELALELDIALSMRHVPVDDGEYVHSDGHGDKDYDHYDTPARHVDGQQTEHGDRTSHYDSGSPRPGATPPKPGEPHGDMDAGHLDETFHTDYNPGDHIDYVSHGDSPPFHYDIPHIDSKIGHLDRGVHPDIA